MNSRKPLVLIYPPPSDPTQPYTSLPTLTAHLRAHGVNVIQRDVGIELLNRVCSRAFLRHAVHRANTMRLDDLSPETRASFESRRRRLAASAAYVCENIERAVRLMRDRRAFEDLSRYRWATNLFGLATDIASLPHHPTVLRPSDYTARIDYSKQGLFAATDGGRENVFHQLFCDETVPSILDSDPMAVGISVTYHFQLIPAFTLARALKKAAPRLPIVMGGAVLARLEDNLTTDPAWFDFADYFVIGEGETALLELVDALSSGRRPASIRNLIRRERGLTVFADTSFTENFRDLPCPDYTGLDLDAYFSPEPVLLLPTTRGCYYGKCTFCDVSRQTRTVYRPLGKTRVAENIAELHRRHGAQRFFFCDDAVPMTNMLECARLVREQLPQITWQAEARLEKTMTREFLDTLHAGGCRQLIFGFESASQRVLDLMSKHNRVETDQKVLQACAEAGIAVNLQTFIGLPGETEEEARSTIHYLLSQERHIASIGFGVFALYKDTPIYREPEQHCIEAISLPIRDNLLASCDFVPTSGMSRADAQRLHDEAMEKFREIYATRSLLLGGASGAHSLLQLSYFSYEELYEQWQRADAWQRDENCMEWLPRAEDIRLGEPNLGEGTIWLFNAASGMQAEVPVTEVPLIERCDGARTVYDLALNHAGAAEDGAVHRLDELTRYASTLRTLVCSHMLDAAAGQSAPMRTSDRESLEHSGA